MPEDEAYIAFRHIRSIRSISSNGPIDALRSVASDLGLPALPWTAVAEDEVVSELVSQYFATDYLYVYPPIPRSKFLREMKARDPGTATCSSPLLVNAICAHQCVRFDQMDNAESQPDLQLD